MSPAMRYRFGRGGWLFPLILIAIGVLALLANVGLLSWESLANLVTLWPLILVLIGVEILLVRLLPAPIAGPLMLVVVVVVVAAAVAYAALVPSGSFSRAPWGVGWWSAGIQSTDLSAPLGRAQRASVRLETGAARVEARSESLGDTLYRAHVRYPAGEGAPRATVDRDRAEVRIEQGSTRPFGFGGPGRREIDLRLTTSIPWGVRFESGASQYMLDLADLQLTGMEIQGGANRADIRLPKPKGTVRVVISGGSNHVDLHLPAGAAARVATEGGANSLNVPGGRRNSVFGSSQWESDGYRDATDRYDVSVTGGANQVRVG